MKIRKNQKPILIILVAGIGDLVMGSAAIRAFHNAYPDRDIHLVTSTQSAPLARNYPYINQVWTFPIREIRYSKIHLIDALQVVWQLRKIEFGLAVNLYLVHSRAGALRMGKLFRAIRADEKIGHGNHGFERFVTKSVPKELFDSQHRADAMMAIAHISGGKADDRGLEVFWDRTNEEKWKDLFDSEIGRIIGINPGGDRPNRRWSSNGFSLLADRLGENGKARIVLLGGPGEEAIAERIEKRMRQKVLNLAGRLTLNDLVYITSRLDLLVTNDSAPMHIAAALGIPLVALFGPGDPARVGPCAPRDRYRAVIKQVECRPCDKDSCEFPTCLDRITAEEVYDECMDLLLGGIHAIGAKAPVRSSRASERNTAERL
jgi:heptosyltransferase II